MSKSTLRVCFASGFLAVATNLLAVEPKAPPAGTEPITNGLGMKLVPISAGEFLMGTAGTADEQIPKPHFSESPQHRVRITKPFYLGQTEVTQGQWESVMGTKPWTRFRHIKEGSDYPATTVSWEDVTEFCRRLSKNEGKTYRLPTEAEWEYACRAGTATKYHFGDDASRIGDYACCEGRSKRQHADQVGRRQPNAWGLYDMHGNVWEWCSDWYGTYDAQAPADDPVGPAMGECHVYRGGGWSNFSQHCRSAVRSRMPSEYKFSGLGFRVVLIP